MTLITTIEIKSPYNTDSTDSTFGNYVPDICFNSLISVCAADDIFKSQTACFFNIQNEYKSFSKLKTERLKNKNNES